MKGFQWTVIPLSLPINSLSSYEEWERDFWRKGRGFED